MPVYTYKCQTCNAVFSIKEALFEKPITQCPSCITGVVRRIPQQPVVFFDNSGRYASHRHIPHGERTPVKHILNTAGPSAAETGKR